MGLLALGLMFVSKKLSLGLQDCSPQDRLNHKLPFAVFVNFDIAILWVVQGLNFEMSQ